ncbi:MAG TPA: heavy metal translocating P-type ATPase [Gemmatimonadales bacterium]|nr:heavy metal translocating P-type ATPase [Gemmatimonadales bacterium]
MGPSPDADVRVTRLLALLTRGGGRGLRRYPVAALAATGLTAGSAAHLLFQDPVVADRIFFFTLIVGGVPLVGQTLWGMLHGRFAADIVAMLAIVGAFLFHQYFAGTVIVLMQSGGEALEAYAMDRASASLQALLARAPRIARRLEGDRLVEVPVEAIRPGELMVVRPGDLVPVDGEVTAGTSSVDQSALTGEPLPIRARPGTALMSGGVNLDGALTLRAVRPAELSQYQQIVKLVARARREKPPIQRLADRYAVWFTPLTLGMCGVAYAITHSPTSVLAVLVVATPCPLILATPIAVIAAIARAAAEGIIVKTGVAIEQIGRARVVVFDKTGTLTLGRPTMERVVVTDGGSPDELLRLAAAVEQRSGHHLGHAVAEAARRRGIAVPEASEVQETPGLGVTGTVLGHTVAVGSLAYHRARGVVVSDGLPDRTSAYVTVDGAPAGYLMFADRLRHQVPGLMQRLVVLGVTDTVMLTGDRQETAEIIAAQAGIHTVLANLLPADKVAAVQDLKRRHEAVVMVGDGINDAPALAAATVGVALGAHGAAASAEAADVVLLVDDITRVAEAVAISQRMRRIAMQSIGVGLGVSTGLMVIAAAGHITPAIGALLQEALDAAVILNALRARNA